jgi:hypothetical protein
MYDSARITPCLYDYLLIDMGIAQLLPAQFTRAIHTLFTEERT